MSKKVGGYRNKLKYKMTVSKSNCLGNHKETDITVTKVYESNYFNLPVN